MDWVQRTRFVLVVDGGLRLEVAPQHEGAPRMEFVLRWEGTPQFEVEFPGSEIQTSMTDRCCRAGWDHQDQSLRVVG